VEKFGPLPILRGTNDVDRTVDLLGIVRSLPDISRVLETVETVTGQITST
jgi:hypothetical protein